VSDHSGIEWTDATWNPVTGCTKVSAGCDHCYAATFAERWRGVPGHHFENGFDLTLRPDKLTLPLSWRKPRRIFVNSMSDLFHADIPDAYIARVFAVMAATPQHTYQVLTKRPARMRALVSRGVLGGEGFPGMVEEAMAEFTHAGVERWPLPHVWLGVSVEDQHWTDIRVPALIDTPAAVRFLSCEPLLGPIDLSAWMPTGGARWQCVGCHRFYGGPHRDACPDCGRVGYWTGSHTGNGHPHGQPIGWVIAGGESGHGARPMHPDWVRGLRDQTTTAGVPFLFKQWGGRTPKAGGRELDGRTWDQFPPRHQASHRQEAEGRG
jgi:protein gp37